MTVNQQIRPTSDDSRTTAAVVDLSSFSLTHTIQRKLQELGARKSQLFDEKAEAIYKQSRDHADFFDMHGNIRAIFHEVGVPLKTIDNWHRQLKISDEIGCYPYTAYEFIDAFTDSFEIRYGLSGECKFHHDLARYLPTGGGNVRSLQAVKIAARNYARDNLQHIVMDDVESNISVWTDGQRYERLAEILSRISIPLTSDEALKADDAWKRWIGSITETNEVIAECVMKHFVWQVKRKLAGMPVDHHMMPVFVGGQGGGKSTAIETFAKGVIGEAYTRGKLDELNDTDKVKDKLIWRAIVFFGEMAKAAATDVNILKDTITLPDVAYRVFHSQNQRSEQMRATFIGDSNVPVRLLIKDPTGMRRFFEIVCLKRLDWDAVNNTDYALLWRSVDHNDKTPILPVLDQVRVLQETYRHKPPIELFTLEYKERVDAGRSPERDRMRAELPNTIPFDPYDTVSKTEYYQQFRAWATENGFKFQITEPDMDHQMELLSDSYQWLTRVNKKFGGRDYKRIGYHFGSEPE